MTDRDLSSAEIEPFNGEPIELKRLLEAEARATPGKWARRVIGGKAFVALRVNRSKRRWELMIWRECAPVTLYEKSRWEGRVRDLQRSLKCLPYQRGEDIVRGDTVVATFQMPVSELPR